MTELYQIIDTGLLKHVCAVGAIFVVIALGYLALFIQQSGEKRAE